MDFEFVHANVKFTICLCPDLAKTFFWDVKATKLGKGIRGWEVLAELLEETRAELGMRVIFMQSMSDQPQAEQTECRHGCANWPFDVLFCREGEFHCHC